MGRSIILGVVGDSAAGKTTLTRGLVRVLGEDNVTHVCVDDYHRYDRRQRAERNITPLDPDCNYIDIMAQQVSHLRNAEPILKPVYQHHDGTFGPLVRIDPKRFSVVEGLLGYYSEELRSLFDVRIYLAPTEDLRRKWKVQRDCSRRGYTTDQVLSELDRREPDSEAFIRPQRQYADIVVSFLPSSGDQEHLDAELVLRPTLKHPDFRSVLDGEADADGGIKITEIGAEGFSSERDIAKVSVVGAGMRSHPGVAAAIFEALADAGVNIEIISTSSIRVSCVVPAADCERAVNVIHERLKLEDVLYEASDGVGADAG